ncbi:MAG TPA: hypothetical protein VF950_09800 [Planctomycetota bacterium]
MNCTSCKKPLKEGATKCACGAAVAANYSYDLLPDEPAKKEESGPGQQYALPPGSLLPPGMSVPAPTSPGEEKPARVLRADRARGANSMSGGKTNFFKLGVGAGAVLIVILLGMKMCGGTSTKITGANKLDQGFTVYPASPITRNFEIIGQANYSMTIEAKTGDVNIGVQMRSPKDKITPEVVKGWSLSPVKKGESKTLTGELGTGTYSFVIHTDVKTGVQGKIVATVK